MWNPNDAFADTTVCRLPTNQRAAPPSVLFRDSRLPLKIRFNISLAVDVIKCMRIMRGSAVIALMSYGVFGQSTSSTTAPRFEVASVKSNKTAGAKGAVQLKPGSVTGTNVALKQLMRFAYELQESQISGPGWIETEGYDVTARPSNAATAAQLRLMLQTLLEDRFKLKSHRETKEMPVYYLMVADGGPRLRDPKEQEAFDAASAGKLPFRPGFGGLFSNKDLPGFAERLSRGIGHLVVDKTGIKGRYWFQLEWASDHDQFGTASPSLLSAIQEQLGLKLEEHVSPTEVLVIDHVEKPSDN